MSAGRICRGPPRHELDKIQSLILWSDSMAKPAEPQRKIPSRKAVLRAVASSTAVETGQSVAQLERRLQQPAVRFPQIKLAR